MSLDCKQLNNTDYILTDPETDKPVTAKGLAKAEGINPDYLLQLIAKYRGEVQKDGTIVFNCYANLNTFAYKIQIDM